MMGQTAERGRKPTGKTSFWKTISDKSVENIQNSFIRGLKKSVDKCARELRRTFKNNCSWSFEKNIDILLSAR
jgi:hypothetical protein